MMNQNNFERGQLYENGEDFFLLNGNSAMKLSPKAAAEVCKEATKRELFVGRIEAGYWRNPGFQPDSSTTWDSKTELESMGDFKQNNDLALENISDDAEEGYTAFLITILD